MNIDSLIYAVYIISQIQAVIFDERAELSLEASFLVLQLTVPDSPEAISFHINAHNSEPGQRDGHSRWQTDMTQA
jgi:hypothetical protein